MNNQFPQFFPAPVATLPVVSEPIIVAAAAHESIARQRFP